MLNKGQGYRKKNTEMAFKSEGWRSYTFFDKVCKGSWSDAIYMHVKHYTKKDCVPWCIVHAACIACLSFMQIQRYVTSLLIHQCSNSWHEWDASVQNIGNINWRVFAI